MVKINAAWLMTLFRRFGHPSYVDDEVTQMVNDTMNGAVWPDDFNEISPKNTET